MVYVSTFGGAQISPSQPSLREVTLTADQTLFWPRFNYNETNVVADQLVVDCDVAGLAFNMPEANLGSVGYSTLFTNEGTESFDVNNNSGNLIATVAPTQAVYITLRTNTTVNGVWMGLQFAVGSAAVTAAALAGKGLQAISGLLTTAWPMTSTSTTPLALNSTTNRSTLINWTGGVGIFNLPAAATLAELYYGIKNSGSGSITLTPNGAALIDGAATKVIGVGESFIVVTDGTNWFTIGNRLQFTATRISIDITGSGTYTLSASEQGFSIYEFTGVLSGNRTVAFPAVVGQYILFNNSTGPYSLTIQTTSPGLTFTLPQGAQEFCWTDGSNFYELVHN